MLARQGFSRHGLGIGVGAFVGIQGLLAVSKEEQQQMDDDGQREKHVYTSFSPPMSRCESLAAQRPSPSSPTLRSFGIDDKKSAPKPSAANNLFLGGGGGGGNVNFVADAASVALPSVVHVSVAIPSQQQQQQQHQNEELDERHTLGEGSGFVISSSSLPNFHDEEAPNEDTLLVVTNSHVVLTPQEFESHRVNHKKNSNVEYSQGHIYNRNVTITTHDGERLSGTILSFDVESDLALLTFNNSPSKTATTTIMPPPAKIGQSSTLRHGSFVLALGSPLSLQSTVTLGIISNPSRSLPTSIGSLRIPYLQTDASINRGNSGGPLIDIGGSGGGGGEVVGVNVMKHPDGEGVSFAIPMDCARDVLGALFYDGEVGRFTLGFGVRRKSGCDNDFEGDDDDDDDAKQLHRVPSSSLVHSRSFQTRHHNQSRTSSLSQMASVVEIVNVRQDTPAYHAGIRSGDVIIEFDGRRIHDDPNDVIGRLGYNPYKEFEVKVRRKMRRKEVDEKDGREEEEVLVFKIKPTI